MGGDGEEYIGKGKGKKRVAFAMGPSFGEPRPSLYNRRTAKHQDAMDVVMQGNEQSSQSRIQKKIKMKHASAMLMAARSPLLQVPSATLFSRVVDTRLARPDGGLGIGGPLSIAWTTPGLSPEEEQRGRPRQRITISPATLEVLRRVDRLKPNKPLSIIDKFAQDSSLFFALTSVLPIASLIDLYSISKGFHKAFNHHATASILASADTWSPNAQRIFPWRCYLGLCVKDPIKRQQPPRVDPHKPKDDEASSSRADLHGSSIEELVPDEYEVFRNSRDVPSLRWLQMVAWRHGVAQDIVDMLDAKACNVDPETVDAIKVSSHPTLRFPKRSILTILSASGSPWIFPSTPIVNPSPAALPTLPPLPSSDP
jgi:hypothetical protein